MRKRTHPLGFNESGEGVDPFHDEDFVRKGRAEVSCTGEGTPHQTCSQTALCFGDLVGG